MQNLSTTIFVFIVLSACSPMTQQAKQDLAKPINCATADGDIRVLQSEKAHVGQQILSGVTAVVPAGAVIGVVTGTEGDKLQVASGEYNKTIDEKIAAIKKTCAAR